MSLIKRSTLALLATAPLYAGISQAALEYENGDNSWKIGGQIEFESYYTETQDADDSYTMKPHRTRFYIRSNHGTGEDTVKTRWEYDFGGKTTDKDVEPRLRHALISWRNWSFGQTWSTYNNSEAFHFTVDDAFPAPIAGLTSTPWDRNPQIRYTLTTSDATKLMFALEKPAGTDSSLRPEAVSKFAYNSGAYAATVAVASYQDSEKDSQTKIAAGLRTATGLVSYRVAFNKDNGKDAHSTSASIRYDLNGKKNWIALAYEKAEVAGITGDRGYLTFRKMLAPSLEAGLEYSKRGINADNTETDIYRFDLIARY